VLQQQLPHHGERARRHGAQLVLQPASR
jgi:hypothetical protein